MCLDCDNISPRCAWVGEANFEDFCDVPKRSRSGFRPEPLRAWLLKLAEGLPGTAQEKVPKVERNDAPSRLVRVLPGWSTPEHGIPMRTVIWSDISPN